MNHDTLRLLQISAGTTLLGATPVILGLAPPRLLLGLILLSLTPFIFLGLLDFGIKSDEVPDADDAWAYESGYQHDD